MSSVNPTMRKRWLRRAGLAAVVLVPLAFAGLVVGALAQGDQAAGGIPVAIVNQDTLQKTTQADGTVQNVFAGRLLVTELTGSKRFDWTITNEHDAAADLESGRVYAILTVPKDFSSSILSISGENPQKAGIAIRTDDAHSYLTGSVAQVVGQTMADTFGRAITEQYIGGVYSSIGGLTGALGQAADGATQLSGGANQLSSGLVRYTDGVDSLANGLDRLNDGAAQLSQLSSGIATYTSGVSQLSGLASAIDLGTVTDPTTRGQLQALIGGLHSAAEGGAGLSSQAATGISGIQSGIAQSSDGAWALSNTGPALVSGATGLADGATSLATGLRSGAAQVPAMDSAAAQRSAKVAADPVGLKVTTDNPVTAVGQVVATFAIPLGLWIGALAVFLVLRPVTRRALTSTARGGRLVASAIARAGTVTAAQAVLLVALLHLTVGVDWSLLPATLIFSLLTAGAFTAFHYLLTIGLGRAGLVVSLLVLAVQVTSTGGVYPIEVLSTPFQLISPFLPLTYAVDGMQGIISGGDPGAVVASALVLAAFGAGSVVLALFAIRRTRRATTLGIVPKIA